MLAMTIPIVSVLLHHIRDPSDVPQLHAPEYRSSGTVSASSSMNDVLAVDAITYWQFVNLLCALRPLRYRAATNTIPGQCRLPCNNKPATGDQPAILSNSFSFCVLRRLGRMTPPPFPLSTGPLGKLWKVEGQKAFEHNADILVSR